MTDRSKALPLALLLAAATASAAAPAASALGSGVKDPEYTAKATAFKTAIRTLPEPAKVPLPGTDQHFLGNEVFAKRADEHEAETVAAVDAVRAFAAVRDSRVFEELVKGIGTFSRHALAAEAALEEATTRYEQVAIPHFESREAEFRQSGQWPTTISISLGKSLDTTNWQRGEAAHVFDFACRIRDAMVEGLGTNLALLGPDRGDAWKAAVKMGTSSPDFQERMAFCDAVKVVDAPEAEETLLAVEAKDSHPLVVAAALEALSLRLSKEGFARMVKRLESPELNIVVAAVRGIARYRSPQTIPTLIEKLRKSEGRVFTDIVETLFAITGKHQADDVNSWETWWKREGPEFLHRWSDDVKVRLETVETIGLSDERLFDIPSELAALLPTETDAKVREAILDNLSIHKSDSARITLMRAMYDPQKSTRVAAIRGLAQYRHVSVPEELIRFLARADKDEISAIFQSLRTIWGGPTEFSCEVADREKILQWWGSVKDRVPQHFLKLGAQNIASGRKQQGADEQRWRDRNFYGLKVDSDRVLFVVDVSLSMEEPAKKPPKDPVTGVAPKADPKAPKKIDAAKSELTRVLRSLPERTVFGLIFFSSTEIVWDQGMVTMTPENRKKALQWVEELKTHEATNIYDAMQAAFQVGTAKSKLKASAPPDTIFLVSDGAPTAGKFLKPDIIREHVRRWNKGRGVKVHVVGVGEDHDVVFCRNLAEENGGYYVAR